MPCKYRVLAVDGALNHSGWVILDEKEDNKGQLKAVASDYGIIKPNAKMSLAFKLSFVRSALIKIIQEHRPDVIVFEETYAGKNALTNARLNNAKGVFIVTVYEVTGKEPVYVTASIARSCLGFKNNKEEPFAYFSKLFGLEESFLKGNDITDAYVLGFWYIRQQRGECAERQQTVRRRRKK